MVGINTMEQSKLRVYAPLTIIFLLIFYMIAPKYFLTAPLSNRDIEVNFNSNKSNYQELVKFCMSQSNIKKLTLKNYSVSYRKDTEPRQVDGISKVFRILDLIKAKSLHCVRRWGVQGEPLAFIVINLYSSGLGVSGTMKGVKYFSDKGDLYEFINSGVDYEPLSPEGWYIFDSSS